MTQRAVRLAVLASALSLSLSLAACGSSSAPRVSASGAADAMLTSPPTAAAPGPCPSRGSAPEVAAPPGLPLPDGALLWERTGTGQVTTLRGYVPGRPPDVHAFYDSVHDDPDDGADVISLEMESWEVEALLEVTAPPRRALVRGIVACEQGLALTIVIAQRDQADAVPVPSGQAVRSE